MGQLSKEKDSIVLYLDELMRLYPELRFGQLMHILNGTMKGIGGAYERDIYEVNQIPNPNKDDIENPMVNIIEYQGSFIDTFNVEDADFVAKLKENFETDFLRGDAG